MKLTKVFEPGKIGNLELKNRLVVSAMSSHMGNPDGTPNEAVNAYLVAKVKGGWGLVFTEDLGVTKDAGSDPVVGSLWSDDQVPAWTETVRQVHAAGGLMGAQIYHAGRQRSLKAYDTHPVAPSALKEPTEPYVPRALTVEEIHDLVKAFGEAAARAKRCGFDCVEIHGAHGYLINQFMSTFSNKRTDEYGGTLANRMRFALEVIAAVREAVGADYPVIFRFNTCDYVEGGIELPEEIKSAMSEIDITPAVLSHGNKLMQLTLPDHTLAVMVKREGRYFIPKGNTELKENDKLLMISDNDEALLQAYDSLGVKDYTMKKN